MAVVLSSEDGGLFSPSGLRRSHSQTQFMSKPTSHFHTSSSTSHISDAYRQSYQIPPSSSPSSAPSSPQTIHADSNSPSSSSTPATNLSLDGHCEDDHVLLPNYDENPYFSHVEDPESPSSPQTGGSYTVSPVDQGTPTNSRPESPDTFDHAEDDTAVRHHPTQHVDYLSHNWKEEDIWSSWRYIVSKRGEYGNASRLENASWRTWMKAKYQLRTVSPETLNWLKDCDVTWLYGPLQTRQIKLFTDTDQNSSALSRCDSFIKKPILKKRSMSEVMLQKSLSSSSLLKQATAAVQAQQDGPARLTRPVLQRAATDYITFPFSSRRLSRMNTSVLQSKNSSGVASPSTERKHIHFDEQVQQCIAVDVRGEEDEDEEVGHGQWNGDDDSDSDGVMMKKTAAKKKPLKLRKSPKVAANSDSRTIAMLPSTTLKSREDSEELQDTAMRHSASPMRSPVLLSPTGSQETLRPSKTSGKFYVGDSDEDEEEEEGNSTPAPSPTDALPHARVSGLLRTASTGSLSEPAGMRRTESGMLMPYVEGEVSGNDGIIGRVLDTVNTARDIAHVIWNVGWRK